MGDYKQSRIQMAFQMWFYAIQRFDLLVISVSGAGLYVCLETIKHAKESGEELSKMVLISGSFFLLAVVINFISQMTGKRCSFWDMRKEINRYKIDFEDTEEGKEKMQIEIDRYDAISDKFALVTRTLNVVCATLMMIGLTLISIFFFFVL